MKFCFGDIVVVEDNLIGVIVKSWSDLENNVKHEVYVRNYNSIKLYNEDVIERYMVRHKYLNEEEINYQYNAINNKYDEDKVNQIMESVNNKSKGEFRIGWDTSIDTIIYESDLDEIQKPLVTRIENVFLRRQINDLQDFFNKRPRDIKFMHNIGPKSLEVMVNIIYKYCEDNNIETKYDIREYRF